MAATLPAINSGGLTNRQSPTISQHQVASPKRSPTLIVSQVKTRGLSVKEQESEDKKTFLRSQQPALKKWQTAQYRNTYKHTLCLDMLQDGFHQSFTTLFLLIQEQNVRRERAGPESALWNQPVLENEPEKLEMLKAYLTKAEDAERKNKFTEVYGCQFKLAKYFQETGDKWLSDFFFNLCLVTSRHVTTDGGWMAASGHLNVGLALEESGEYFEAVANFEVSYRITQEKADLLSPLDFETCNHLSRIYTTIAEQYEKSRDLEQYLAYLKKAYDMAKEGGEKPTLGRASYRLGKAYEKNGEAETALLYLNGYLDISQKLEDLHGIGKACEAIAKAYQCQGQVEKSIEYLEMFVEVAERSKDDKAISRACTDLGGIFNALGRYEQGVEYFNKSYNIARAMNDQDTINSSRVLFGVAAAHKTLAGFATHLNIATGPCLERLIEWKDNRGDEFDKPIPEPEKKEASE